MRGIDEYPLELCVRAKFQASNKRACFKQPNL